MRRFHNQQTDAGCTTPAALHFRRAASATVLALLCSAAAWAVPAKPGVMTFDNAGHSIEVRLIGDENCHFYVTTDGYMLLRGADGVFRYAIPEGRRLRESPFPAENPRERRPEATALLTSFGKDAPFALFQTDANARQRIIRPTVRTEASLTGKSRVAAESELNTFPTVGEPKCLAILVEFQDVKFTLDNPAQLFGDMLNKEGFSEYGATGSARDYFTASSGGTFRPQFDIYGPVTLPYNMSYYGGNDMTGNDARPYEIVPHAVDILKDEIDFSQYDTDHDGVVDNIYFFYAGYGEADGGPANSIWPHSWNVHDDLGMDLYFDGVLINHYATSNELSNGSGRQLAGIGVFCHEFSHVLGLPDLYSTTYSGAFTPSEWSLMDHGSYNNNSHTPPLHTGYERYCLGWLEPKLLKDPANITIGHVSDEDSYGDVYLLPTEKEHEYYIFENRQQQGWDRYIPGHGMLAWHIDYVPEIWRANTINVEKQHIDIVEADNILSEGTRSGDSFPGTASVTEFTDDTTPALRSWSGAPLRSPITNITESRGTVSFAFKGGEDIFGAINAREASEVKCASFTANWDKATRATSYLFNLYTKGDDGRRTYLEGYRDRELGDVSSLTVTDLTPETTYYYTLSATDGRFYSSESNEVSVTTTPPTLDYLTVTARAATEVTGTSFRANWEPLPGAENYEIDLFRLELGEPFYTTADFTDRTLPAGWESDGAFDGRGSYAVETPSLRFTADGMSLTSAPLSGIRTLGFWYRAGSPDSDCALEISTLVDNSWTAAARISPLLTDASGTTVTLDNLPSGSTRVRITFRRGDTGSVSIDDVKIGYGGNMSYHEVPGMQGIPAGAAESYLFTDLEPDTNYGYSVTATAGDLRSKASQIIGVLTGTSGIESVTERGIVTVTGRDITVTGTTGQATVTDLSGRILARGTGEAFRYRAPQPGIYLVTVGGRTVKASIY